MVSLNKCVYLNNDLKESHAFPMGLSFFCAGKKNREPEAIDEKIQLARENCFKERQPKLNCNNGGEDAFYVAKKIVDSAPKMFTLCQKILLFIINFFSIDGEIYTKLVKSIVEDWKLDIQKNNILENREDIRSPIFEKEQEPVLSSIVEKFQETEEEQDIKPIVKEKPKQIDPQLKREQAIMQGKISINEMSSYEYEAMLRRKAFMQPSSRAFAGGSREDVYRRTDLFLNAFEPLNNVILEETIKGY